MSKKIVSTSDYIKIFEHFFIELVNKDISSNINKTQYGGKKGVGTEHLLVKMVDRIKQLLDDPEVSTVILNSYDWKSAFDKLGIRSSIITNPIDFMRNKKMQVKMNEKTSFDKY